MKDSVTTANLPEAAERQRYERALTRLDRYARLLDSQFRIPFTRIRFGLDPLIGLLPGLGDVAGLVLSLYLVVEAVRLGTGPGVVVRMLGNVLAEFVIGLVPVLGDLFDVMWRANERNAQLLRRHIDQKLQPGRRRRPWLSYLLIATFAAMLLGLLYAVAESLWNAGVAG